MYLYIIIIIIMPHHDMNGARDGDYNFVANFAIGCKLLYIFFPYHFNDI